MTYLTATGWLASFYDELTERRGNVYVVKASAIRPVEREDGNFDIALIVAFCSKGLLPLVASHNNVIQNPRGE